MREFRRDPIIGRWVIVSTERAVRPSEFLPPRREVNNQANCPFCPGNEQHTPPEITALRAPGSHSNGPGWHLRVVPNRYPALRVEGDVVASAEGIYDRLTGVGAHEVIIETDRHDADFCDLAEGRAVDVFRVFRDRIQDLKRDVRFEYILIFKNCGSAAGATLSHPHAQLIALPMVPIRIASELNGARRYHEFRERCVFCDIITWELQNGSRIVAENDDFVAVCPYASRFPFEVWVLPRRHHPAYEDIREGELARLAAIVQTVNRKLNQALEMPPYNYLLHNAPLKSPASERFHWHLEIIPRTSGVGGFEWGTGFYINPTPPEEAAQFLRDL